MGITAVMGAANRGSDDILELLVKKGATLDVKDKQGRTPLVWAEGVFLATNPPEKKPSTMALIQRLTSAMKIAWLALWPALLRIGAVAWARRTSALLDRYCVGCHNEKTRSGGLAIDKLDLAHPGNNPETWEKVVRKIRAGMMPPSGMPRPGPRHAGCFCSSIGDGARSSRRRLKPNPGTTGLHRLNRTEYANSIRDLLALEIDPRTLLPADDSSEGFDNIADALAISPALLERYVATATKISRLAVGDPATTPSTVTYRVPSRFVADAIISKACR